MIEPTEACGTKGIQGLLDFLCDDTAIDLGVLLCRDMTSRAVLRHQVDVGFRTQLLGNPMHDFPCFLADFTTGMLIANSGFKMRGL